MIKMEEITLVHELNSEQSYINAISYMCVSKKVRETNRMETDKNRFDLRSSSRHS